jgi:hypothetical protein
MIDDVVDRHVMINPHQYNPASKDEDRWGEYIWLMML